MEFTYRLTGTGWAESRIADGDAWAVVTASYLSDALGDLLRVIVALLDGATEARCSWEEEPGEYRWVFTRGEDDVHLRILAFPDVYRYQPDDQGELRFEMHQPLRAVAEAVSAGAQRVLDEYGEDEYLRRWVEQPFPTEQLASIRQHLGRG